MIILTFFFSLSCGSSKKEQTAVQYALDWLALADQGKYTERWDGLADLFKKNVKRDKWIEDLKRSCKPFSKLLKRELQEETKSSEPPVGDYIIFRFKSSFENRKDVVEAVSVIKKNNGKWGISGYSIT